MELNKAKFEAVIKEAKVKAAGNARWERAIDRAAQAILAGELIVTVLADSHALVTSSNGSYWVNGKCECKAAQVGHRECYHRAGVRLVEMYEAEIYAPKSEPKPEPTKPVITRSVERDYNGTRVVVVRCNGWMV